MKPISQQLQVITLTIQDFVSSSDGSSFSYIAPFQKYIHDIYSPLSQGTKDSVGKNDSLVNENVLILQKRIRELDLVLEQYQNGTTIPRAKFTVPDVFISLATKTQANVISGYLEKFNPSQVDHFFGELNLEKSLGNTQEERESFLKEINNLTKLWPVELSRQLRLVEAPFPGSIEREINFWREMEKKLTESKEQLESASVLLTKLFLKKNNRVAEQLIRESELELDKHLDLVRVSNSFLRDFPLEDLLTSSDLNKLNRSTANCLQHFTKLRHSKYDFNRASRLLESLGILVFDRLVEVLLENPVLQCNIDNFRALVQLTDVVFQTWEVQLASTRIIFKDVAKRRNEKVLPMKFDLEQLNTRIHNILEFREQHVRLITVFDEVLSGNDNSAVNDLNDAYQVLVRNSSDILDISSVGEASWISLRQIYEQRLIKTEERITKLLEERLTSAKTAEEMFNIFSTFNPLFFRSSIRNAVNSFRSTLVRNVKDDVKRLQEKFHLRYDESKERSTADLRDIPPLAGRIIWARQIENQLHTLMKRLEDVIGHGWEDHLEGKQLKEVCDELGNYLDTNVLYNDWLSQQLHTDMQRYNKLKDFLFLVEDDKLLGHSKIRVNFDERQVVVFKEVQYLEWLLPLMKTSHKSIPRTIQSQSSEAYARYPIAMALQSALTGFLQAQQLVTTQNELLLASHITTVRDTIKEAFGGSKKSKRWIKWDSSDLQDWVNQLSNRVSMLQERVTDVNGKLSRVDSLLQQLVTCKYDHGVFMEIMQGFQVLIDEIQMRGFSNITIWVHALENKIEDIICKRIKEAINTWSNAFNRGSSSENLDYSIENMIERELELDQTVYELLLSNQVLYVSPPLEQARVEWISLLHQYLGIITNLPRLVTSRFNVFANASSDNLKDFSNLLSKIHPEILRKPLKIIEDKFSEARVYSNQWLQYQSLWDMTISNISDRLGKDISKWLQLLTEIRNARSTIDVTDDEKSFGPIVINHQQIHSKVNVKYDSLQKEIQNKFSFILLEEMKLTHNELISGKTKLEGIYLDNGSTRDIILGVEYLLKMKQSVEIMKEATTSYEKAERLLLKQRFAFPRDWLSYSNVAGALNDLLQILSRRLVTMETQLPSLQAKICEENNVINKKIQDLIEQWESDKPIKGGQIPSDVATLLNSFSIQINRLLEDSTRIVNAKASLEIENLLTNQESLNIINTELLVLKEVWIAIAPVDEKLTLLKKQTLRDIVPSKLRKNLEELSDSLRQLPGKLRAYEVVIWFIELIAKYISSQSVVRDLCSEALKDRHWKLLLENLAIPRPSQIGDLTIGSLWSINLLSHKKIIGEVLSTASGELALEQYLKDLRDFWLGCELNISVRDNLRLITGWDVLFSTLEDNLNSLASLKQSPYFRNVPEFQEDTANWEGRLTNLRAIFDAWVEVQRKWIYLRGIFRNVDIKNQLPSQFTKFKSLDNELSNLMKRVLLKPKALELLQIENLFRQLERHDVTMSLIQKALGEYLEKQRQFFPRFYFVNNDDLVEIIGNSSEPTKILVHLSKMFAAVNSLEIITTDESTVATKILSKEGEAVALHDQLLITPSIKDWLCSLETQISITLANLVQSALQVSGDQDGNLLQWISMYPAQIVILSCQVAWSQSCELSIGGINNVELIKLQETVENRLKFLSASVLSDMESGLRKKTEQLLTEMVHQRDVTRLLTNSSIKSKTEFSWLYHLRFYWSSDASNIMERLCIRMSNASFFYGFEYLGIGERLVQTPLTDRCYLTLTQALSFGLGANPFGPVSVYITNFMNLIDLYILGRNWKDRDNKEFRLSAWAICTCFQL